MLERASIIALLELRNVSNRLFKPGLGRTTRPVFFDVDQTYPPLRLLDDNFDVIRDELLAVLPGAGS
jgi:aspartate beta-hydroxylase/beta-hydroxylase